jgi:hypothetical protein
MVSRYRHRSSSIETGAVNMKATMRSICFLFLVAASVTGGNAGIPDLSTLDVCVLVPGDEVARAVAATLQETKRFNSPDGDIARCVYIVTPTGNDGSAPRAFAVELEPPSNFTEVRPYVDEPTQDIKGLGDGAWASRDPDIGRFRLWVLRRGVATLYLTGDDEDELRKIADLVLSKL